MNDAVDHIMQVMEAAFDPAFGEAWNRRQVSDSLLMANCRCLILDRNLQQVESTGIAAGFLMSRQAVDEEEVLLIAVRPDCRRQGIAATLLNQLIADANQRGVRKLFLEMRENNPAEAFYLKQHFIPVGRRPNYYRRGAMGVVDAITFERSIEIAS